MRAWWCLKKRHRLSRFPSAGAMLQAASSCGALPLSQPLPQARRSRAQRAAPKKCHQGQVLGSAAPRRLLHASCAVSAGVVRRRWAVRVGVSSSLSFRSSLGSTSPPTARPAPARRAGARWTAPTVSAAVPQPSGRSDATVPSAAATLAAPLSEPLLPVPSVDLSVPLPQHPLLLRGQLPNGLRYVVLPNRVPPNRFEAHLEMHAGSVDEGESEQGVAHFVEHVTFLGSRKREKLLGACRQSLNDSAALCPNLRFPSRCRHWRALQRIHGLSSHRVPRARAHVHQRGSCDASSSP